MINLKIAECFGDWLLSCGELRPQCSDRTYTTREAALDQMLLHLKWYHKSDTVVVTIQGDF